MARKANTPKAGPSKITPLWIVATFVSLTETVLGYALTQVTGGVQIALTCFVIIFAILVAGAFFVILWNRPYVFYSPAEYGETDPKHFIDAMRGLIPDRVVAQIEEAEAKPKDNTAQFTLMDSLIDEATRQHLILMREKSVRIPFGDFFGPRFETGNADRSWMSGSISGRELAKKLGGSGLVTIEPTGPSVQLTELGAKFADWLVAGNKKNEFYSSDLGGWGTPKRPEGLPPQFFQDPRIVVEPPPNQPDPEDSSQQRGNSGST